MSYKSDCDAAKRELDDLDRWLRKLEAGEIQPSDGEIRRARRMVSDAQSSIDHAERAATGDIRAAESRSRRK